MAYCPKCKAEYESHVELCADCNIELVPDLDNHVYRKPLIKVKKAELEEMLRYLDYSGIKDVEVTSEKDGELIMVPQESYEQAVTYLKVYIHEHMEETNEDDYYFDEYEVEDTDTEGTVADMKSTVYTFGFVGAGALVVAVLNYLDIITIAAFDKMVLTVVLLVLGVGFILIAVKTAGGIGEAAEAGQAKSDQIDAIVDWYRDEKGFEGFYKRNRIKRDEADEGALYFFVFDILKKEVSKQYPEVGETILNAAIERIYEELN